MDCWIVGLLDCWIVGLIPPFLKGNIPIIPSGAGYGDFIFICIGIGQLTDWYVYKSKV